MKTRNRVLIGALAGVMLATPVLAAADDACLQHNRIWSTRVVDPVTVVATDQTQHRYTIHMNPGCVGLTNGGSRLVFRTWQNLGCVDKGSILGVEVPGMGFVSCSISGVTAGAP